MKIISHRGNINGVDVNNENKPSYIDIALSLGYDVEIDIWWVDNNLYLGHDNPDTKINFIWLKERKNNLWIHCKNLKAVEYFSKINEKSNINFKFFCHQSDKYALISDNHIWLDDLGLLPNDQSIIPLLDKFKIDRYYCSNVYAACVDDVLYLQNKVI